MRPAARSAGNREALDPERIGDRSDIADAVHDSSAGASI
jgi:hypothetical protein